MDKIKISPDFLYKYLQEHNFTISMLAKKMDVSNAIVTKSFRHDLNRHGKPISLSKTNIERMNLALEQIAEELRGLIIPFGSEQTYTNQLGNTYDPSTLQAIQKVGKYFNLKAMTERVLGWNKTKRDTVLSVKSSKVYGNVTQDNVSRINAELLSVAGVLSSYEVVVDES